MTLRAAILWAVVLAPMLYVTYRILTDKHDPPGPPHMMLGV